VCAATGLVYFFYDDGSRSEDVIIKELKGYEGVIQSDGLGAYKKVALQSGGKIVRVSCLQHCKRAFLENDIKDNPDAKEVSRLANSLYHNEHQHKIGIDGWTVDDNLRWRREYAPPILKELKAKLEEIRNNTAKYPPKSQIHKAADHLQNQHTECLAGDGLISFGGIVMSTSAQGVTREMFCIFNCITDSVTILI